MAEPEAPTNATSPEQQLFARLRLQRVVFGALAVVLVTLSALGLSAYQRMQHERDDAKTLELNAIMDADAARNMTSELERKRQQQAVELLDARRQLGLAQCRLAIQEFRDGDETRAAALLAESRELGPPAWWPLVAHLLRPQAVRFEGSEAASAPVIAGATSLDRKVVAVARDVQGGVSVEVYGAEDGKLKAAYRPVELVQPATAGGRLLLNRDGSAWYLVIPGRAYYGSGGEIAVIPSGPIAGWEPVGPVAAASDPELSIVCEAYGPRGLVIRKRGGGEGWTTEVVTLDLAPVDVPAVCVAGDKPVIASAEGIYMVGPGGRTAQLLALSGGPHRCALHHGPGAVFAAELVGRELELTSIELGGGRAHSSASIQLPDETFEDVGFMIDGTAVCIGRNGRMVSADFAASQEWTLGGYTLSFVDCHPSGLVFANRRGELSLLPRPEFVTTGVTLRVVPPGFSIEPSAHGFLLAGTGAARIAVQRRGERVLDRPASVALSRDGPAWFDGEWNLPDGSRRPENGSLLGAFADGSLLLFQSPQRLKRLSPQGVNEFLLPNERTPVSDSTAIAAQATAAALLVNDTVYFTDMHGDPRPVAGRRDIPADLVALDAAGGHLAIAYGATTVILNVAQNSTSVVRTSAPPRQIAVLFDGSVLATIESGALVLYEANGGRELLRAGTDVTDMAASGVDSLNLVVGSRLHELKFGP